MSTRCVLLRGAGLGAIAFAIGCLGTVGGGALGLDADTAATDGEICTIGFEGCACTFGGGCNFGFACVSGYCVSTTCGDGLLQGDEQCDDADDDPNDACTNLCTIAACGDGVVYVGFEECDLGQQNGDGLGCSEICTFEDLATSTSGEPGGSESSGGSDSGGATTSPTGGTGGAEVLTFDPVGDAYIRPSAGTGTQGDTNYGTGSDLQIRPGTPYYGLVQFDPEEIDEAVAGRDVVSATLILEIDAAPTTTAGPLRVHQVLQPWDELRVTWNCGSDGNPGNAALDCDAADAWDMAGEFAFEPWVPAPIDEVAIIDNQIGSIALDVTSDVAAVLDGSHPHHGWLLRMPTSGRIDFLTRETAVSPQLVVEVQ